MKKKIVISLCVFSLILLIGGYSTITTIEKETSKMNTLIKLHQAEILREQLLLDLKDVQSDLTLKNTRHARSINTTIIKVRNLETTLDKCFDCHHSQDISARLDGLNSQIGEYKDALSKIFTVRANSGSLKDQEDRALRIGNDLIDQVNRIINLTNPKLIKKTTAALSEIARTKGIIYMLVALGPLSIAGIFYIFIMFFTRPLNTLLTATQKIKDGDLDYRIEGLKDEFGKVAESFNEMSGSLKEQMIKMQRTEQMVILGELAAGLAHEIRNPLTGIKLSMEVISEDESISEENKDTMIKLVDECKRIDELIKNLLNFAKPPKPQFVMTDVNTILDKTIAFSVAHFSAFSITDNKLDVMKHLDSNIPEIMADPMKLQQAFLNLLLNARHSMLSGGTLTIKSSFDEKAGIILIEISDTGEGIDEKAAARIFQPFFTTKPKGTGLGLAITKRLIEQHDGAISAKNIPGGGAAFLISLPIKRDNKEDAT